MAPRPLWQQDDCPAWCVAVHREDDHPHDRQHVGATRVVPVVQLAASEPTGSDVSRAAELVVLLHRRDGTVNTWLYVGDGSEQSIEVSPGSWRSLVQHVGEVLAEVDVR